MANFKARQLAAIRDAVAAGRDAMREAGRFEPGVFARAFVAAGGVHIPGRRDEAAEQALAARLLDALNSGEYSHPADRDLQREVDRARNEAKWTAAQADDKVVGFFLMLPESAHDSPVAEAVSHDSHGLGPGIYRKGDIVVLQPECDGARFVPVLEDEIEC
jgi:hypothetical protein